MITLVAECPGKNMTFSLSPEAREFAAGSLPENAIYLPYQGISRKHFRIYRKSHSWYLEDLESRNGTFLNGERITEALIHPGDVIQVGIVLLTLRTTQKLEAEEEVIPIAFKEKQGSGPVRDTGEMPQTLDRTSLEEMDLFYFPKLVYPDEMIPGVSDSMFEVLNKLHSIAGSDVNVLLVGETGAGKEMLAETIHLSSGRSRGPFVAVNCAAIPEDLAETEMFGIGERVATDVGKRSGLIARADGGTLFLDELSAFPVGLQAKLLRAVEEKKITPVGEKSAVPADFRIVSTSNEDPKRLMDAGRLREDLYHRLATVEVVIPPLRDRKEDIHPLVLGILRQLCRKEKKEIPGIKKNVLEDLGKYDFPGNVRELMNILKAMMAMARPGEVLSRDLLPDRILRHGRMAEKTAEVATGKVNSLHAVLDEVARNMILDALHIHNGNISRASRHLHISPRGMRKMMHRLGIPSPHKPESES